MINERAKAILEFCFIKTPLEQWFKKDDEFDNILKNLFLKSYVCLYQELFGCVKNKFSSFVDSLFSTLFLCGYLPNFLIATL